MVFEAIEEALFMGASFWFNVVVFTLFSMSSMFWWIVAEEMEEEGAVVSRFISLIVGLIAVVGFLEHIHV